MANLTPHDRVAAAFKASAAPRFLTQIFELPAGAFEIHVDAPELAGDERTGTVTVWQDQDSGERRLHLRFSRFGNNPRAQAAGLVPIYAHYEVFNDSLWVSYSEDETPPETRGNSFALRDIIDSELVIEDMCDFLSLDLDSERAGSLAPPPSPL